MLAKLGPLVSAVTGSVGGTTFQRSANGLLVKSKPLPTLRRSTAAVNARQRTATLNTAWFKLDESERAAWADFALTQEFVNRFGDPVTGTAYMAFMRCNQGAYLSAAGSYTFTTQTAPPADTSSTLPAAPAFQYDKSDDELRLVSTDPKVASNSRLFIFATPPRRPLTRLAVQGFPRVPFIATLDPDQSFPADLTAAYLAVFGRLPLANEGEGAQLRVLARSSAYAWPGLTVELPLTVVN